MTTDAYWSAVRTGLVEHVSTAHQTRRRRLRLITFGTAAAVITVGAGAAFAADALRLPGADEVTVSAVAVGATAQGTRDVDLGTRPANTEGVQISLRCLSAGSFTFEDGAGGSCAAADVGQSNLTYYLRLAPGQHSTTITAGSDLQWAATFQYSHRAKTQFGVNEHGKTYGVMATDGRVPDLVAVVATNGKLGYVDANELGGERGVTARHNLSVYLSDGTTVIGRFTTGG